MIQWLLLMRNIVYFIPNKSTYIFKIGWQNKSHEKQVIKIKNNNSEIVTNDNYCIFVSKQIFDPFKIGWQNKSHKKTSHKHKK